MDHRKKLIDLELNENTLPIVEQIADSMPGGFFIYYAEHGEELIYYNSAMLRIFGCDTREEFEKLTNNSFKGIVHPDDIERVEASIEEQIRSSRNSLDYVEYRITRKDGSVCWVEDYGHFVNTAIYGNVFYVFIEDATERMEKRLAELERVNAELREAYDKESQYRKAILHSAFAVFEVNLTKNEFITTASQVADERMSDVPEYMKITPNESYSDYIEMRSGLVHEDEQAAYRQFFNTERLMRCCYKGEMEQIYEAWSVDSMGRRRLYHYSLLLGKQAHTGDVVALCVCTDITEQIERQNLLQIAFRQAQSANIARSAFLMNMSHDIRTPLNAIIGYTDLLLGMSVDPKVRDYSEKIREAGSQLLMIVKESMEVTWAESGKAALVESSCNIDQIIREVTAEVEMTIRKKKLSFLVESGDIRHRRISADTIRLKEILGQLLDNAVKYTNEGGTIRLEVREQPNAPEGYGQYVFVVQDTGPGIADEFKENIFQAFSREKNTTMSRVLGTGLGLALVKTYVDMMEGTIEVDSRVGEGSTFTVKLLFKTEEEDQAEECAKQKSLERSQLKGKRILLVEDNELNAEIAEALLAQSGFVIETAENGQVAVDKVRSAVPGYYCAVLMDIQMPVMDGYEATRAIRGLEDEALANIPIIALSANAFPEDRQKSLECGMDAHFPKPIDVNGLVDLMCRVLAKVL